MGDANPLISQVITFHNEGVLAHFTLSGLLRVKHYAQKQKIPLEFVLVLDKADALTTRIVKNHPLISQADQILEVSHGDPGLSRNSGVNAAAGDYISMMDGDDYCSQNWPVAALARVLATKDAVVVHPEVWVCFEASHSFEYIVDMEKSPFPLGACLAGNFWTSCSFGQKAIYLACPYQCAYMEETGFGHEDWHWNVELLSQGIQHVCAPETAHFYRRRFDMSRLRSGGLQGVIIRPSSFFDKVDNWVDGNAGTGI